MRTTERRSHTGVIQRLIERPHGFGFFQAVRLLDLFFRRQRNVAGEVVSRHIRFGATLSNSFPPSEIEQLIVIRKTADQDTSIDLRSEPLQQAGENNDNDLHSIEAIQLIPSFFGLVGQQGALPAHYTEKLAEREWYGRDRAARRFLELFSNRATALFYAAWKKYRLALHYETNRHDTFMPIAMALAGYSPKSLRESSDYGAHGLHDEVAAHYAGMLRHRPVSAVQMQRLLKDYFGVALRVEQFVGHWYSVPDTQRTRLGNDQSAQLGRTALCGARVWQSNLRVRLWLGPLKRSEYENFLPQGSARRSLVQWLHMLTGDMLEYEVKLILDRDAVSGTTLQSHSTARLGWDAFMATRPATTDRADISYTLHQLRKAS